jgi:dihydroxy-acid dehydratase
MVGHVSPEAAHGGPIARLREGDRVRIDVATRRIDVHADLSSREPARIAPRVTGGALAKYALQVGSASRGAVTTPEKTGVRAQFPSRAIPIALAAPAEIGL